MNGNAGHPAGFPRDMFYDHPEEQFFLVFGRKLMKLTSCSPCNDLAVITEEDLTGISGNENNLMIVGGNFFIKALNIR
jgi:hypothetical protein